MNNETIYFLLGVWFVVTLVAIFYIMISISNISKIITEKLYPTKDNKKKDDLNPTQWC